MSEKQREVEMLQKESANVPTSLYPPPPGPPPPHPPPPSLPTPPPPAPAPAAATVMVEPTPPVTALSMPESFYWKTAMATNAMMPGAVPQTAVIPPPKDKSLLEAYILLVPLGFLGAHHFYLGRPGFGVLYFFSFGLLGCGWVIDLLRMPCLVSSVNKANREKHQQLQQLKQQLAQQRQQQQGHQHHQQQQQQQQHVVFVAFEPKSLADAYVMWFPCGLFGFHHFYLRNYGMGFLYLFTFGLLGIGWLVDCVRMPSLVREANQMSPNTTLKTYDQCTAHILALSPAGILGGHHYYLDRPVWGLLYTCTLGLLCTGWIWDWLRVNCLVRRANSVRQGLTSPNRKYVDEAYVLCFPFGFTGLHHFYLGRYGWGVLYFFTFGLLGVGWLVDLCRLPCLVKDCNENMDDPSRRLLNATSTSASPGTGSAVKYQHHSEAEHHVTVAITPEGQPPYPPAPGYGYQGYPGGYPTMVYGGPYPSYVTAQGGAGPVGPFQPPQYTAGSASEGMSPPAYEARADEKPPSNKY